MNSRKNNELISIVIVNWNGKKWLKKCLISLSNQTYKNTEIIIVDNGSEDDSVNYIKNYFPKIKVIKNKKNLGLPKANNKGVKMSKGKYLLLINTDVWVEKNFLSKLFLFYKKNDFSVISPLVRKYDKNKDLVNLPNIDITASPAYFFPISRKNKLFYLSSCYFCSKKEYLETLGFDNNYFAYYEDVDWFWRLNLLNKRFDYVENVFIYHAGAGSTGKGINYNMFLYRNQNALQTLLKNYSFGMLLVVLPIYFLQNIFEMIFFLLILKPKVSYSYIEGWLFNIKNIKRIMKQREWIQKRRKIGDWEIIKKMYWGPAKLKMLLNYK